jgi:hypothetical protein
MVSLETTPQIKVSLSERVRVITGSLAAVGLVISGFILFGLNFVINTSAMTFALYVSISIVVEIAEKSKKLLSIWVVSALFLLVSELAFSFLQQFVALCVSLCVLLVLTKYALIKDHDSGWFGALCGVLLSLFFLLPVELILVIGRLFLI